MKGFECKNCGTELQYEQIQGMRVLREITGRLYYSTYCPVCNEYSHEEREQEERK